MPSIIIQSSLKDAGLETARPNTNTGWDQVIWMGLYYPPSRYRLLIQFDLSALPADTWITAAVMRLYVAEVTRMDVKGIFTPYRVTALWNEMTVTWNNQPSFDPTVYGSQSIVLGPGWYEWDVTALVRGWYMGLYPNYGLLLKSDESTQFETKRVYSKEATDDPMLRPILEVSYQSVISVNLAQRAFTNVYLSTDSGDEWRYSEAFDVSQQSIVTVFIKNDGANDAMVKLQISPDDSSYIDDSDEDVLAPGMMKAMVPARFGRYLRVAYRSVNIAESTSLHICYQAQL
ncbi:DNRLRE domain-containing protein [Mahella australiensis]|uniref:DNRLRE domain-containing protein n=1 Tax=Mahella australiensis (strain DSM 15567 / CIP 107919 / 50-1 BON) TaxID=697281 RepID=F4A1Q1_MAHA5|nr:DNRLRE domain-containing protein [Mahella australiensis]AEE97101.1 hypothetical protein Mahau_1925 [Mahella australiensis 50-1 BON]